MVQGLGIRSYGSWFRVLGFGDSGLGFRVLGLGSGMVQGLGFRV
jgi:hypothetical protein